LKSFAREPSGADYGIKILVSVQIIVQSESFYHDY